MPEVCFIIFGNFCLGVPSQDVLSDLLVIPLEVLTEVLQNVGFVCLEVQLEKHMMRDHHC